MKRPLLLAAFVFAAALTALAADKPRKLVIIAGKPSHPPLMHEFRAGSLLLEKCLRGVPGLAVEVHTNGWVSDEKVFAGADAVFIYADGGGGHPAVQGNHKETLAALIKRGVGFGCGHYGVEVLKDKGGAEFKDWIGGYYENSFSCNPIWEPDYKSFITHPITRGVQPFSSKDEWYFNMRFRDDPAGVKPILVAKPSDAVRDGPYVYPKGPYPHIQAAKGRDEIMMWAVERPDGGRGFGFTGGHFHLNWGNDNQRKVVLNALLWLAKVEVPRNGVESKVTQAELMANLDPKPAPKAPASKPAQPKQAESPKAEKAAKAAARKAAFESAVVTKQTAGHAVDVDVDIAGWKELHLVVTDAGDGYTADWADWIEPRLVDAGGKETKLTDLKWAAANAQWGQARVGANAKGDPLKVAGKSVSHGIGTHANSLISYTLPEGHKFTRFKARAGLDNGGSDQGGGSTVQFLVFAAQPDLYSVTQKRVAAVDTVNREPGKAVPNLDVHPALQAELFAFEPMMLNPTSTDIDHRGRVWVCEVVNYRRHKGKRPEGDRILILEDANGDGKADKVKVFAQGTQFDSAHGVCVLGTPDGKGTRAIVSCGDKVFVLTDTDGDDRADKEEVLFSGISGAQHDHGIHAFTFGPDGRFYFNFGNAGKQIKDAKGEVIVDLAGNRVEDKRKPYLEGMVFRCNLDGSRFETLGWNFRNNWMVAVDSFGTLWQSDNDDDGNRGVRINYVMEFGNYGYRDELSGAGWNEAWKKASTSAKLPDDQKFRYHWHLDDPGVVPNLLNTGGGSPTGLTVYEGSLLPAEFRGQVIHCDAGPNVTRAYPVERDGAGYRARIVNVLEGARDRWFRPADVKVAPDGSLIVADWYDPGVGGHNMQDLDRGRLFRVTPKGHTGYKVPKFDFSTPAGCIEAFKSPNFATRYVAWQAMKQMPAKAEPALVRLASDADPRLRARARWLIAALHNGNAPSAAAGALSDESDDVRAVGLRIARMYQLDVIPFVEKLVKDASPLVRRECAIALRHNSSPKAPALWAQLAQQHDGKDRWYVEALGIAADRQEEKFFAAWLGAVGDRWKTPGAREVIWRSRTPKAAELLGKLALDKSTTTTDRDRCLRALDFIPKCKEKDDALAAIALGAL
ncbi:MAG: membrane-bound dehydrogenase domain-containing protein [Limisphaerales bacterium]|nr:MAG: membrane-bound dehydrogenase domain-containing protein [Limisphaerales bacterium]KAG0510148.1 MAG: membrane-bound dehydrogenase domain-containing protein [Limisphaerales bacterium]TXT51969.1 MAG: membrane-bound dehydrogenase domain-containing protein [Limisphaerales bacterium]